MKVTVAIGDSTERAAIVSTVESWGYEPVQATEVRQALRAICPGEATMALVHCDLPGMEIQEFCRAVRETQGEGYVYLIMLGAASDRLALLRAVSEGADDYVTMPVDWQELQVHLQAGRRIINLHTNLLEAQQRLEVMAQQDSLTGIWNRRGIIEALEREHKRHVRIGHGLAVLMADADHFKRVNDSYGHPVGDEVLREICYRLSNDVRPYDSVGRYGGEEFLVVLPECDSEGALSTAERLRQCIARAPVSFGDISIQVTISIGVAAMDEMPDATPADLVDISDRALYLAKRSGRNRVCSLTLPGSGATFRNSVNPHMPSR